MLACIFSNQKSSMLKNTLSYVELLKNFTSRVPKELLDSKHLKTNDIL